MRRMVEVPTPGVDGQSDGKLAAAGDVEIWEIEVGELWSKLAKAEDTYAKMAACHC